MVAGLTRGVTHQGAAYDHQQQLAALAERPAAHDYREAVTSVDQLFSLRGRRALVTGGSSGIGRAMAAAMAGAGARVHLVARDPAALASAAAEMGATWSSVDLADEGQLASLAAVEEVTGADILVTAAGVNLRPPLEGMDDATYATTMQVNLRAPYVLGQAAGPRMAGRGYGRIINVGSQQSWSAFGSSGVYGVSKAAVCGLTRSQAEAWSPHGVTANTVVPGFVVTPMTLPTIAEPGREEALAARSMIGRNGLPDDFAGIAVFLASAASAYVTGQAIAVDGGFSVH